MKCIPSSSTSYYKTHRCKKAETMLPEGTTADESVSIEAAHSSTHDEAQLPVKHMKPSQSYIAMIGTAIMESESKRMSLGSIYKWIETKYPFFKLAEAGQGWRNSVRHNLSLNDCFIKVGRCEDGKGNYWSIHPQNKADFQRGDFRQKQRRRRGKKKTGELTTLLSTAMLLDPSTGSPLYSYYTEAERKAYRLDEALMRQSTQQRQDGGWCYPATNPSYYPTGLHHYYPNYYYNHGYHTHSGCQPCYSCQYQQYY